jgi:hypothetical protein
VQNDRRQFSKSEREMPYRRAVDEIARGVFMLSTCLESERRRALGAFRNDGAVRRVDATASNGSSQRCKDQRSNIRN